MPQPLQTYVELEDVGVKYGNKLVLDSVSITLQAGEIVGLIGPGGSGKTQLIRVISTLLFPKTGKVKLFNEPVPRWRVQALQRLRARVGLQFQNFALFDYLNVFENVAFTLRHSTNKTESEIEAIVNGALERVGLDKTQSKEISELSGGMRRRVAIARVMASSPDISVFDDPVAGLDPVNSSRIMTLLQDYCQEHKHLVVIATHDLEQLFPVADRIIALFDGHVAYDGPTQGIHEAASSRVRNFVQSAKPD